MSAAEDVRSEFNRRIARRDFAGASRLLPALSKQWAEEGRIEAVQDALEFLKGSLVAVKSARAASCARLRQLSRRPAYGGEAGLRKPTIEVTG